MNPENVLLSEIRGTRKIPSTWVLKSSPGHRDRKWSTSGQGERNEKPVFNGDRDLIGEDTNVLGIDSGDGCTQGEWT